MSSEALCAKLGIPAGIPCGTHADLVRNLWLPSRAWCFLTIDIYISKVTASTIAKCIAL
jgi:hypothetical protein